MCLVSDLTDSFTCYFLHVLSSTIQILNTLTMFGFPFHLLAHLWQAPLTSVFSKSIGMKTPVDLSLTELSIGVALLP